MTRAMRAVQRGPNEGGDRNALRVAIARDGRIEREWTLDTGRVTCGGSDDVDVFLGAGAPAATLFRVDDGDMSLTIPTGATGRIQLATDARDVASIAGTTIALDPSARGRIALEGGTSVLFQRVAMPTRRERPQLPAVVRGGLLHRVDWLFTGVAAASFMLHFALVVGMSEADWPVPPSLAVIDDSYTPIIYDDPTIPPMPDDDTISDATDPADPSDPTPDHPTDPTRDHPSTPSHPRTTHPSTSSTPDPDPTIAMNDAINSATQLILGHEGIGGSLQSLIDNGQPTTDSATVLASVAAVQPGTTTASLAPRDGHTTGVPGTDFGPRVATHPDGPMSEGGPVSETGPLHPPSITVAPIVDPVDPTIFDDRMLVRALRGRMPQIRACYEHQLSRTPGLEGRIAVSMQVERAGILSHVEVTDDTVGSPELDACVIRVISPIRLPDGPSEPVTAEYPLVFAPQS
jgi:hypothetical protein